MLSIQTYAIQTRYLRETATRGSRIKATVAHEGTLTSKFLNLPYRKIKVQTSITIPFPENLHGDEIHRAAVRALVKKSLPPEYQGREFVSAMLPWGSMAHIFLR